jgi:hypothetical protein
MLRALMQQDRPATLTVLAGQADDWDHHHADEPVTGPIARHRADWAHATAQMLRATADTDLESGSASLALLPG